MATLYKKQRDLKKRKHAPWYFDYTDHTGKRRTIKGFTDKSKTEQLASNLEQKAHLIRTGMIDPQQEETVKQKNSSVESHLADFEKHLIRQKVTPGHVKKTMSRIRCIIEGCEFKILRDISGDRVEAFLGDLCLEQDLGHRTYNHYVQAFEQFCSWLVKKRRLTSNPATGLVRQNCQVDVRRKRRALNTDELSKLLKSARSSSELIQCYDGETRARIYIVSYMTGLRRGEIASLTPESFKLNTIPATLTVKAENSKHRKEDVLPLHPEFVEMLREWLPGVLPGEFLFPKLRLRRTWLMVQKDLEQAGIPYETPDGVADFHAVGRHTYITELLRNGVTLPEARALARHADVNMTMRYTHIGINDQSKAVGHLPNPCQYSGSVSGDFQGQSLAQPVTSRQPDGENCHDAKSCSLSLCDTQEQKESSGDSPDDSWRRGELNPRPVVPQPKPLRA